MDYKSVGETIAKLRKKNGYTQLSLAQKLGITDKAVSRWEKGLGYPDVSLFPILSELFGVTIDHLMLGERKGIAIAGSLILDIVNNIDSYPQSGMMAYMSSSASYAVGGCAANTSIDLAKIDPTLPLQVYGRVGTDENGRYILSQLQKNGISINKIRFSQELPTSFCNVMSVPSGERTFFHQKGANMEFSPSDIDITSLDCDILHIGYVFLLDKFDAPDEVYGTVMARFLHDVQEAGIKTSIDTVSDSTADYAKLLIPTFKYCNYVIFNEIECCTAWGLSSRNTDGAINKENVIEAMRRTVDAGVSNSVIVHAKECCFIMNTEKDYLEVSSFDIPPDEIKGSVGAGDAFCAGCLYGIYNNYSDRQILEFASSAAACSLFESNSVDGMKNKHEIIKISEKYTRKDKRGD